MRTWIVVFTAVFTTVTCSALSAAFACIGPADLMEVEASVPADGAQDVGLDPIVGAHFGYEQSYEYDKFLVWEDTVFRAQVSGPDGTAIAVGDELLVEEREGVDGAWVGFRATGLSPLTTYDVALSSGEQLRTWSFTTGDGEAPTQEPRTELSINLDEYFTDVAVYDCCPTSDVGECPICDVVGTDPVATLNAGFELLPHPEGPGAFVYTLQKRLAAAPQAEWRHVRSMAFDDRHQDLRGSLALRDDSLRQHEWCLRVVAHSVVEPAIDLISNAECRPADVWDDPPQPERDHNLMCEGVLEGEDDVVEDDEDEDDHHEDDAPDEPGSDDAGWNLDEGTPKPDVGCGCATSGRTLDGSLLLLFALLVLRRRRQQI